ncbi:MAG: hypothetical protein RL701_1642 [Pseudomonadota bacterium]
MMHSATKLSVRDRRREKLPQLDVLRGICAIFVALNHTEFQAPLIRLSFFRNSALFVDFFFVLSGFIMTYNYERLATLPELGRFMALRFARVYPLHLVMLFVFLGYETLQWFVSHVLHVPLHTPPFSENTASGFLLNLLLLNGVGLRPLTFNIPSWSISTEFWTYLLFGLVLVTFAGRHKLHVWLYTAIAVAALAVLLLANPDPSLTRNWEFFLPRCVFGFFLGAMLCSALAPMLARRSEQELPLAPASPSTPNSVAGFLWQMSSMAIVAVVVTYAVPANHAIEFAAPFAFVVVIASFVVFPNTLCVRWLTRDSLLWIGKVSYSIYMVHMIVLFVIEAVLRYVLHAPTTARGLETSQLVGFVSVVTYLCSVLGVAALTYRFVEDPGRQLGRDLLKRRSTASRVQTAP